RQPPNVPAPYLPGAARQDEIRSQMQPRGLPTLGLHVPPAPEIVHLPVVPPTLEGRPPPPLPSSLPAPSASLQPLRSSTLGDAAGELTEMRADRRARDQRSEIRKLGKALDQLPEGKIFLHAPIKMKVADRLSVAARIGVDVREDLLKGHVRAGDQTAEGSLRVAHR